MHAARPYGFGVHIRHFNLYIRCQLIRMYRPHSTNVKTYGVYIRVSYVYGIYAHTVACIPSFKAVVLEWLSSLPTDSYGNTSLLHIVLPFLKVGNLSSDEQAHDMGGTSCAYNSARGMTGGSQCPQLHIVGL
jgi:hypothetical protein